MTEAMDLDTSERLLENLKCAVCQEIYTDPVLLSCSHSFCRECLDNSWKSTGKKSCPMCRASYEGQQPTANRALNDTCEAVRKETRLLRSRDTPAAQSLCRMHVMELQLYCMKDQELLCAECVTQHKYHELVPLKEGLAYCKGQLTFKVNILEKKLKLYKTNTKDFKNTKDFIKNKAEQAAEGIKEEFNRLRKALDAEQEVRLKDLADEERDKICTMEVMVAQADEGVASLSKLIETLKREMGDEDATFMQKYLFLKESAQWPHEDLQHPPEALLDMAKHVGNLGFNIWKKLQDHVQYYSVVLDTNTASPWLDLTPDLTSMKESQQLQSCPDNLERFNPCVFLLGSEGFSEGKHRWDVVVGDNPKWVVGVCAESLTRKKKFTVSPKRGVWSLAFSKGELNALSMEPTKIQVEMCVEKVRIKLDMDKGEVSFWDCGSLAHIFTFQHKFSEKMFPLFGPGLCTTPMVLVPGMVVVHTS